VGFAFYSLLLQRKTLSTIEFMGLVIGSICIKKCALKNEGERKAEEKWK
jgi:hypothetical protein